MAALRPSRLPGNIDLRVHRFVERPAVLIANLAEEFSALIASGEVLAAADKYWARDVASIDPDLPDGTPARLTGFAEVRDKLHRWTLNNAMEDVAVDGPFISGDHFALFIDMIVRHRSTGKREPFSEIAIFTVRGAKIIEQRYFYQYENSIGQDAAALFQ